MIDELLKYIAPHLCCGCDKVGTVLCSNCKNNIESEYYDGCLRCGRPTDSYGRCFVCRTPYDRVWCIGKREDTLQRIIGCYKFNNMYAAGRTLADLLVDRIGVLPTDTYIVPVPTAMSHIRERGYDHMACIAREISRKTGCPYAPLLRRISDTKQRGQNKNERLQQAKHAFTATSDCKNKHVLLIDDVVTTGATIEYAAMTLRQAGAASVWVGVIARQPLD